MISISILDIILINFVSFIVGVGSGVVICIKNKDKLLIIKSKSNDNLSNLNTNPVLASTPQPVKITVE